MKIMTRVLEWGVSVALLVLMVALMLLITVQIVMRYQIGKSLSWSLEVSQILFIWIVFLGAALAVKRHQFAAMDLLARRLPRWWSQRVVFLAIVAFAAVFGALAIDYVGQASLQQLTMTGLPSTVIYVAPVLGSFLMVVFGVEVLVAPAPNASENSREEHPGVSG